jgi:RNA recognition motif-containing protein
MESSEVTEEILANDQIIDGRKVDCKRAVPRDSSMQACHAEFRTKKVFVGGLPNDITDESFRAFFEQFGAVEDSVVMYDRDTSRPRGFGFITFEDEESTERLLSNSDGNYISGKWIDCKKAVPRQGNQGFVGFMNNNLDDLYDAEEFVPMNFNPHDEGVNNWKFNS